MNYEIFSETYDSMERIAESGRKSKLKSDECKELEDMVLFFATLTPDEMTHGLERKIEQLNVSLMTAKTALTEINSKAYRQNYPA